MYLYIYVYVYVYYIVEALSRGSMVVVFAFPSLQNMIFLFTIQGSMNVNSRSIPATILFQMLIQAVAGTGNYVDDAEVSKIMYIDMQLQKDVRLVVFTSKTEHTQTTQVYSHP